MTLIYFIITKGQQYKVNHTKMMADVVMLFALLDDLYTVEFNFVQEDYGYGGVPITREEAGKVLDADIEALGKTKEIFLSEMPEKIADLQCLTKVNLEIRFNKFIGAGEQSIIYDFRLCFMKRRRKICEEKTSRF
jgi:hypothetical protein